MDWFLYLKSVLIGLIWAGSLWLTLGLVFPVFPIPALYNIQKKLYQYCKTQLIKKPARGEMLLRWAFNAVKMSGFFILFGLVCAYVYTFVPVLGMYLPESDPQFWNCLAAGSVLPSLYLLVRAYRVAMYKAPLEDEPVEIPDENLPITRRLRGY